MKVLVNAYSCSPFRGSEPGLGWNWCINMAKYCELFIITEAHWKENIELELPNLEQRNNMHFYYNAVPEKALLMARNQGDWRFYWYYKKWQRRTLDIAKKICSENKIDIVHQLNWVAFREPGYLWKLNIPMVWGPIGGLNMTPKKYLEGASWKWKFLFQLKNKLTMMQLKYSPRVKQMFSKADYLISSTPAAKKRILEVYKRDSLLMPETGCYDLTTKVEDKRHRSGLNVIWVGRFIYTKRLDLALRAIAEVKDLKGLRFHVVGYGTDEQEKHYRELSKKLGIDMLCEWHGKVEIEKVHEMMRNSDILFFTSILEATSTVVPEAINNCLPILCFNTCGFGPLVSDKIGRKVELTTPEQSVKVFAEQLRLFYEDKDLLYSMSLNCQEALKSLLWSEKISKAFELYTAAINNKS